MVDSWLEPVGFLNADLSSADKPGATIGPSLPGLSIRPTVEDCLESEVRSANAGRSRCAVGDRRSVLAECAGEFRRGNVRPVSLSVTAHSSLQCSAVAEWCGLGLSERPRSREGSGTAADWVVAGGWSKVSVELDAVAVLEAGMSRGRFLVRHRPDKQTQRVISLFR